jgi:hypothetical protein
VEEEGSIDGFRLSGPCVVAPTLTCLARLVECNSLSLAGQFLQLQPLSSKHDVLAGLQTSPLALLFYRRISQCATVAAIFASHARPVYSWQLHQSLLLVQARLRIEILQVLASQDQA